MPAFAKARAGKVGVGCGRGPAEVAPGAASRLGAAVIAFHFINYGLMGGYFSLAVHGILIAMVAATVYWRSGRQFGLDRWLYRRWPNARIW